MAVHLSLGYDIERPYGEWAKLPNASEVRQREIECVQRLNSLLDSHRIPRTYFILGQFLESCLADYSPNELRAIFDHTNPLVEIQQHSYSHPIVRPVRRRPDKVHVTVQEFIDDLIKASEVLERILGVKPDGLRTPLGYPQDFSDMPELLKGMNDNGFVYVSSDLRGEDSLLAPLNAQRQPHTYGNVGFPNLVEVPSHGWQDDIFTREKAESYGRALTNPSEILQHYIEMLKQAGSLGLPNEYIALCLHPWAINEYDPDLGILRQLLDFTRQENIQIIQYGEVANQVKSLTA